VEQLVEEIEKGALSEAGKSDLFRLIAALGLSLRFCRLEWCGRPFIPKRDDHQYCCSDHKTEDWNKTRRHDAASEAKPKLGALS